MKNPFGRKESKFDTASLSVDDLMVLERFEEAEKILQRRLKRNPKDLRSRLKMADLFMKSQRQYEAVDEYILVADGYTREGFYDKAIALLSKVEKLVPGYEKTRIKLEKIERAKRLERSRQTAMEAILAKRGEDFQKAGTSAFEVQQLWQNLSDSLIIQRLDGEQLARLFKAFDIVHYPHKALIAERGQLLEELYLIAKGKVEVSIVMPDGKTMVLREFQPGDVFGERALLEHLSWPATYRAGSKTTLMKLTRQGLEQAITGNANPRQLLDALRDQRLDANIDSLVRRTEM